MSGGKLKVLSLFAGIGGFDLGLERTGGFETVAFCEIEPFAVKVLNKHWPHVPNLGDVATAEFPNADIICAGFPCQDISNAGQRAGLAGERSGLWREVVRAIRVVGPRFVLLENVAALLGRGLGEVLGDLAESRNDAEWDCIPAASVGAPHLRDRIYIIAYPEGQQGADIYPWDCWTRKGQSGRVGGGSGRVWPAEPAVGRVADGIPDQLDRLKALGNAVVPQIPELIGRAILATLEEQREAA